jgi:hypothetical protein
MKSILTVLLSGLILCGCSQKQAAPPAIDLVVAGKDITWHGGIVLHVTKRDGASLEGIQISSATPDGRKTTVTGDTGTVMAGSAVNAADDNSVRITIENARIRKSGAIITGKEWMIVLQK